MPKAAAMEAAGECGVPKRKRSEGLPGWLEEHCAACAGTSAGAELCPPLLLISCNHGALDTDPHPDVVFNIGISSDVASI